jgi:arylsulfatase A-like enzyme
MEATSRREFIQGGIAALGDAMVSRKGQAELSAPGAKRPNLVFFLGEGQRSDAWGLGGNTVVKTPNQDRIGREGVNFQNSFVTNALCGPARASILTGMYSHSTGALDNNTKETKLPASIPLFTDLLHDAGYEVAICGKVHVCNGVRERYWDYYLGFNAPSTNYYHPEMYEGRDGKIEGPFKYEGYADDLITDKALEWLKQKREKPFCLLLWQQAPHSPFYRARRHLDLYNGIPIPIPATFDDDKKNYPGKPRAFADADNKIGTTVTGACVRSLEELVKDYYAGLVVVDENVGRVLNQLTEAGQLDDTAILQSSDHGFFLGEWRMFDKRLMHEPSIRVPTTIRYPKAFTGGRKVDEMVLELDLAPTLLELAGIEIPDHMQGKSLIPLAKGEHVNWREDWLYEYFEFPGYEQVRPHRGVRSERYKYIHYYQTPEEFELYDLENDPGELRNLCSDPARAELLQTIRARLAELRHGIGDSDTP